MVEYRKATAEDADVLARIRADFLAEANSIAYEDEKTAVLESNRRYMRQALADGSFAAWIAAEGEEIVATSGVSFYLLPPNKNNPSGKTAYISNLFTYPRCRKKGIATRMFALIVEEAAAQGCVKVTLEATEMGRPIYERFGFKVPEDAMSYYIVR